MDQFRRIFNHHDAVMKECKLFVKTHDKQILDSESGIALVRQCVESMKENLVLPTALNSTSSEALTRSAECNKSCQGILALARKFTTPINKGNENPEQKRVYEILESQAQDINAAFHRESNHLRSKYEQLKGQSVVSGIE